MSNYLFLGKLFPKNAADDIEANVIGDMQTAADSFQWNLINGLEKNLKTQLDIYTLIPVSSYPKHYKKPFVPTRRFSHCDNAEDIMVGFNNVHIIKRLSLKHNLTKQAKTWAKNHSDPGVVFIYTLDEAYIAAAFAAKKINKNLKICCIIADLPSFLNLSDNTPMYIKKYQQMTSNRLYGMLDLIDYYVLLTEGMAEFLKLNKPYTVVEGIATDTFADIHTRKTRDNNVKAFLYAGTLHKKFGVGNLLDAFEQINDKDIRLVLCGVGDCEQKILDLAKKDSRIIFKGKLKRDDVLRLMLESDFIINPRQPDEDFTKYSFPSKNLEALSSGTPLIAYKLDGIPDEYNDRILYIEKLGADGIAEAIEKACSLSDEERIQFGENAKAFALNEKNNIKQTKKILDLIGE